MIFTRMIIFFLCCGSNNHSVFAVFCTLLVYQRLSIVWTRPPEHNEPIRSQPATLKKYFPACGAWCLRLIIENNLTLMREEKCCLASSSAPTKMMTSSVTVRKINQW